MNTPKFADDIGSLSKAHEDTWGGEGIVNTNSNQVIQYKTEGYSASLPSVDIYILGYYNPRN